MRISFLSDYAQNIYAAIPGETTREKVTCVAKQLALCGAAATLYYLSPTRIREYAPLMASWLPYLISEPYVTTIHTFALAHGLQGYSQKLISPIEKNFSSHLLFIATTYSVYLYTSGIINTIFFKTSNGEDQIYPEKKVIQTSQESTISSIAALDTCGLSYGDYFSLDVRFKYDPQAPIRLKERVSFFLKQQGLVTDLDLIEAGIIGENPDRWSVYKNLEDVLSGGNVTKTTSAKIPEKDKFYTRSFNILLTTSTLSLQVIYDPWNTIMGVALGVLLQDNSVFQLMNKLDMDKIIKKQFPNYDIPDSFRKSIDIFFIFLRKEKTALDAPTPLTQKCRQIWEGWNLAATTVFYPNGDKSFVNGLTQGQTLAAYWRDYHGYTGTPAPTETPLSNPNKSSISSALLEKLTQLQRSAEGFQ